jgi:16S rRNA (cytosine1402-N4)-methyltransferase
MNISFSHQPVLAQEVVSFFKDKAGAVIVDATAGGGGHLSLLANVVGTNGKIFAFDQDARAHLEDAAGGVAKTFSDRITLIHAPFSSITQTLKREGVDHIDGLLCDLGVSSNQLDDKSRGFSFLADGLIDMRMDTNQGISAYDWLKVSSEEEIANTLFRLGGERKSRAVARLIKKSWPIENSTLALAKLVLSALRQRTWSKIHPATRTFQAIRMAVNNEVGELETLLKALPDLLATNGVAVFISFHSLEDRLIKHSFRALAQNKQFAILTKKPLMASEEELEHNRRARSAKLRAIMRVS